MEGSCDIYWKEQVCNNFEWTGDNYFWMGGGSLVKVANTLKFNNDDWSYGFYNTTGEYSVISAKAITTDSPNTQWRAWYEGKIYVDTDEHFDFVKINDGQKNMYTTDDVVFTRKQGTAPVSWEESTCRPAYKGNKTDPDPIMYYYYAFEDLGAIGDFDFNDVVLRLSAPENGISTVQLCAAGGTLPVQVVYNDANVGREVHTEFGVDVSTMVNTGYETKAFVTLGTVNIAADADMANLPFGIVGNCLPAKPERTSCPSAAFLSSWRWKASNCTKFDLAPTKGGSNVRRTEKSRHPLRS